MRTLCSLCLISVALFGSKARVVERCKPKCLAGLPDAIEQGIVINYHTLTIPGLDYCYNPAYIQDQHGTNGTLIVRVDGTDKLLSQNRRIRRSELYAIRINDNLNTISKPKKIATQNEFSEDPRAIRMGNTIGLICNEQDNLSTFERHIVLHTLDSHCNPLTKTTPKGQVPKISPQGESQLIEKNWTPLYDDDLFFIYSFLPYTVLSFGQSIANDPKPLCHNNYDTIFNWKAKWGEPRGGTPFVKINNRYLGFFHSSFLHKKPRKRWFVFGAIELSGEKPFLPTRISPEPLFSSKLYCSERSPTAPRQKFVLYPSGISLRESGKVIRLFCGLNDSKILVIDLDRDALESSLINM